MFVLCVLNYIYLFLHLQHFLYQYIYIFARFGFKKLSRHKTMEDVFSKILMHLAMVRHNLEW